jgi:2-dehydro-3-deoxyphosphogluconate aldolase/(4S)-4-hydroxy-2-oxoglutarate aldolase
MTRSVIVESIVDAGAIAIIRMTDVSKLMEVVEALKRGGVRCIEITLAVPRAVDIIERLATSYSKDLLIGAGTVLDRKSARQAIEAGAKYLVSPTTWPGMIETCHRDEVVSIPGAFTPTEVSNAWNAGADIVKLFPANAVGPQYIQDLRRPLPHLRLLPTSGITIENAREYIRAGACAVGIGAALVDPALIGRGDFSSIAKMAQRLVESIEEARRMK